MLFGQAFSGKASRRSDSRDRGSAFTWLEQRQYTETAKVLHGLCVEVIEASRPARPRRIPLWLRWRPNQGPYYSASAFRTNVQQVSVQTSE